MHSLLTTSTDLLRVITGSAADLDCVVSFIEYTNASPPVLDALDTQFTNINTATTSTILAAPSTGSDRRRIKAVSIVNTHASVTTSVRVIIERTGPVNWDIFNTVNLAPGESLTFTEGTGWFHNKATGLLDAYRYVTTQYTNATTSFSDITGLTVPVEANKHYCFEAALFHQTDATTTGARFGINGPAMTLIRLQGFGHMITASVTAATQGASATVTALDTAAVVETTGPGAVNMLARLTGYINPSASGTFAVRGQSEVAVAGGLVVWQGSWLHLWETPKG